MLEQPLEKVSWRMTEEALCRSRLVGAHLHEVVDDRSRSELGLGQSMMTVMEKAQVTIASLNGRARPLEELGTLFNCVSDEDAVVVAQRREH